MNLLTNDNSTTIHEIEQQILILQQNCQLTVEPSRGNKQQTTAEPLTTHDHVAQYQDPDELAQDTDPNQPAGEKRLIEDETCTATIDQIRQRISDSLRKQEDFETRLHQLDKTMHHHLNMLHTSDAENYGFKACLSLLHSLKLAVNLVHQSDTAGPFLELLSSKTNKTREACSWVDSYTTQLAKDTKAAELQMKEGISLYKNVIDALNMVGRTLSGYRSWELGGYFHVEHQITEYLAGNISKVELGGVMPRKAPEEFGKVFIDSINAYFKAMRGAPNSRKATNYNFMLKEGLLVHCGTHLPSPNSNCSASCSKTSLLKASAST